jgi:hypothetical protein
MVTFQKVLSPIRSMCSHNKVVHSPCFQCLHLLTVNHDPSRYAQTIRYWIIAFASRLRLKPYTLFAKFRPI